MTLTVINLFAGPGAGKSTTAAGLFYLMKLAGYSVELVTEYAKELVYEGDWERLMQQSVVFKEQKRRQRRLIGKVEYAVTDSPLLLSHVYGERRFDPPGFTAKVNLEWSRYDNIAIGIRRVKPYAAIGRTQTEEEARQLDVQILSLTVPEYVVDGDFMAPQAIFDWLQRYHLSKAA